MVDITMCKDKECPDREKCARFKAVPDSYHQSWFIESPRKDKKSSRCEYFMIIWWF